ncbi:AraC family transcriptional regulator [Caballeronia sordidicola]|uniref:AraC family transcriptional regulator n=1 Tax=Caballeronia sordidicola TaxID=196367 RepID=A0A158HC29_CABSO|nr:helix-turn-helix domain-containing protein [Caballeronia sordidicola]SAL41888.1 AraC family transcriptional regulator [Caballeronia sordidicola]
MRAFAELTDDSPMMLLEPIHMQLAVTLPMRTTKSIGEIADDVGYRSEATYSRKFKETYGVGPGAVRQAGRGWLIV